MTRIMQHVLVTLTCIGLGTPLAQARPGQVRSRFRVSQIGVSTNDALRSFIGGAPLRADFGKAPIRGAGSRAVSLAAGVHRLMPRGPGRYERVVITESNVALVRASGLVELVRRPDAEAQVLSRKVQTLDEVQVGIRARGFPMLARQGPADTILLYRQLPARARGQVASTDSNTSFALGQEDAYHPFGTQGRTVRVAMPRRVFDDAVNGRAGAVGWNNLGDGYSTGLEVEREVQIPSRVVNQLF